MDIAKNFAKVTVSTGYDASATSIVLATGHGAKLPTAPFNAVWWNATDYADPSDDPNVEIVRVTSIATDTLTVTRAQESTSASTKNTANKTYKMIAGLTAKVINLDLNYVKVYKAADETVNNSATLQNDDALIIPVAANEVWAFKIHIPYRSGTTPDIKFGWSVPSGATMLWDTETGYDGGPYNESQTALGGGAGASTTSTISFWGTIFVSSTSGNVVLQWAQNTQNASDTKVLKGAHIIAHKLA